MRSAAPYLVLILLALLAPLWADLHWRATFDSDEAVIGLMAAHAGHGQLSLYYWGQRYLGGLDALLSAPLVALAGYQVPVLRVVPVLWFAAFLALQARLAWRLLGRRVALLSLVVLAFPGWRILMFTARSNVSFGAMATLGTALLLLVVEPWGRRQPWRLVAIGVLAGLGLWVHPLSAFYAGPALLVWWLASPEWAASRRRWQLPRTAALGLGLTAAAVLVLFTDGCRPHPWLADSRAVAGVALAATAVALLVDGVGLSPRRRALLAGGGLVATGFVAGNLPMWGGWLIAGLRPTGAKAPACPAQIPANLHLLGDQIVPALWGAPAVASVLPPVTGWDIAWLTLLGLELAAVVAFSWRHRAALLALARLDVLTDTERAPALILLLLLGPAALVAVSGNIYDAWHVRYLLSAWQFDAVVLAWLLDRLLLSERRAGLAALALFCGVSGTALIVQAPGDWVSRPEAISPAAADQAAAYLRAHGIQGGYAPYWTAYAFDFLEAEYPVLAPLGTERYPPYAASVAALKSEAILLPPGLIAPGSARVTAIPAAVVRAGYPQLTSQQARARLSRQRILDRRFVGAWDVWLLADQGSARRAPSDGGERGGPT